MQTTSRGPLISDAHLDDLLELYKGCRVPPGSGNCTDPAHLADWEGAVLYLFRVRAGLSRRALRDELRERGHRVTIASVRRWEHAASGSCVEDGDVPSFTVTRALAAICGVQPGQFLSCATCEHLTSPTVIDVEGREGIERLLADFPARATAARRARGMSPRALAKASGASVLSVIDLERGRLSAIDCNSFMWIADELDIVPTFGHDAPTIAAVA